MILTEEISLLCIEPEAPLASSVTMLLALHSNSSQNTTHICNEPSLDEGDMSILAVSIVYKFLLKSTNKFTASLSCNIPPLIFFKYFRV
jgi:hypothetical protein